MNLTTLRAWWAHRQGLDGSLEVATPARVLERSGWARSVAGVGPYLTLFARAGIGREQADRAVADLEIHELPSARGCTYVVPESDFALALRLAREAGGGEMMTAAKLGVTEKEIDKLCDAVLTALAHDPLEPDAIREATGKASRSLGPEGVKKGLSTTLPVALGKLQVEGAIRRVPTNGRLDQQRYRYTLWKPNPVAREKRPFEEICTEMARRYFRWIGPATLEEFRCFLVLGVKATQAAVEPLGLVPMESGSDRLMLPEDRDALLSFKPSKEPRYALVSSLDAIFLLRRDHKSLLDERDAARKVMAEKGMESLGGLSDLPSHAILDRGRLVGLWEYDPGTKSIAWAAFGGRDKALVAAVERTEQYVRDELGDARSFSLDSPKSRVPRIEALRRLR